jgi:hypothetical protein
MLKKLGMSAAVAAIALGGVALAGTPAFAGKTALGNASGTVHCSITGKVKINPPLTNQNTQPSTTTAKTKSVSCSSSGGTIGGFPITKSKGSVISTGTSPGTCSGLTSPGETPFSVTVQWKATGASLNNSVITYANVGPSGVGFNLPSGGATGPSPNGNDGSSITGSFAGEKSWSHATLDSVPNFALCEPTTKNGKTKPAKGIKKLTVASGNLDIAASF